MVNFAPVCPIHIYEGLAQYSPQAIGSYFLLLAHDVIANAEAYRKFFVEEAAKNFGGEKPFIIMDNSVIELGEACNARTLLEACLIVEATAVAMPDALENGSLTIMRTQKFLNEWKGFVGIDDIELMFIPQGLDQIDFIKCVETAQLRFEEEIAWVGVPRNLTGRVFPTRMLAVGYLAAMFPEADLHMLGFSDDIGDDIATCNTVGHLLTGIDSAVPLRLGTQKLPLQDMQTKNFMSPGPRGAWWENVQMTQAIAERVLETRKLLHEVML